MKKIGQKIIIVLLLCLMAGAGYVIWRFSANNETIYPYPYQPIKIIESERIEAEKADILIVGDGATQDLAPHLELFQKETKEFLKTPPRLYNWGARGETLAHVLAKVKSLKKMPMIIIYHGGLDELNRARLSPRSLGAIIKNVELAKNDETLSTIISFPLLSRLIYHPHTKVPLNDQATPYPKDLPLRTVLKTMEMLYTFYRWEAQELTNTIKIRDGRLWFIPQAYNLLERPIKSCSSSSDLENNLLNLEVLLKEGRSKEAISGLKEVLKVESTHAGIYYTLGKAFLAEGKFSLAKKAFYQALIYDCGLKRSNPLFLKILMEEVEEKNFKVIDFNRMVTSNLGRRLLFESSRTPQRLYYESLTKRLVKEFKDLVESK